MPNVADAPRQLAAVALPREPLDDSVVVIVTDDQRAGLTQSEPNRVVQAIQLPLIAVAAGVPKDRIEYWIESPPKLGEARSRLYRRRILQLNSIK